MVLITFNKNNNDLANLIDRMDLLSVKELSEINEKAKERINNEYHWKKIVDKYERLFFNL